MNTENTTLLSKGREWIDREALIGSPVFYYSSEYMSEVLDIIDDVLVVGFGLNNCIYTLNNQREVDLIVEIINSYGLKGFMIGNGINTTSIHAIFSDLDFHDTTMYFLKYVRLISDGYCIKNLNVDGTRVQSEICIEMRDASLINCNLEAFALSGVIPKYENCSFSCTCAVVSHYWNGIDEKDFRVKYSRWIIHRRSILRSKPIKKELSYKVRKGLRRVIGFFLNKH